MSPALSEATNPFPQLQVGDNVFIGAWVFNVTKKSPFRICDIEEDIRLESPDFITRRVVKDGVEQEVTIWER